MRRRAPRYQRSHFHPHTRVGCDAPNWLRRPKCGKFRSAPPRVGDDASLHHRALALEISIHAPAWGTTRHPGSRQSAGFHFDPHPRAGNRRRHKTHTPAPCFDLPLPQKETSPGDAHTGSLGILTYPPAGDRNSEKASAAGKKSSSPQPGENCPAHRRPRPHPSRFARPSPRRSETMDAQIARTADRSFDPPRAGESPPSRSSVSPGCHFDPPARRAAAVDISIHVPPGRPPTPSSPGACGAT